MYEIALRYPQASSACPSDKNSGKVKTGGILLTGGQLKLWENMLFRCYQLNITSKGLARAQNRAIAVTGRRVATCDIAQPI